MTHSTNTKTPQPPPLFLYQFWELLDIRTVDESDQHERTPMLRHEYTKLYSPVFSRVLRVSTPRYVGPSPLLLPPTHTRL